MLPNPQSPKFPSALKAAREQRGMSRAELAKAAGIHEVMPRRYEERDCGEFSSPRMGTWLALNKALGFEVESEKEDSGVFLSEASLEEIVQELKNRKVKPIFEFLI